MAPVLRARLRAIYDKLVEQLFDNDLIDVSAQLAFWNILALFPFVIVVLTLVAFIPLRGADTQLLSLLRQAMPPDAASLTEKVFAEVVGKQHGWLLVVALVGAVWTASGVVSATTLALDNAWGVKETRSFWRRKPIALGFTLAACILAALATAAFTATSALGEHVLSSEFGAGTSTTVLKVGRWLVMVGTMFLSAALAYRLLPNFSGPRYVVPGAIVTTVLWLATTFGFGFYVAHVAVYARLYGVLGAAVVLLLWLYLWGLSLLLGGVVNAGLDHASGFDVNRARLPR